MAANGDACAAGIYTLATADNCLGVTAHRALCGVEIAIGIVNLCLFFREMRRVSSWLRAMLLCYCGVALSIILVCVVALAGANPTLEASYVLTSFMCGLSGFGISCRALVLARVIVLSLPRKMHTIYLQRLPLLLFGMAGTIATILAVLWWPTSLYAPPGTQDNELIHRIGFIVFGVYLFALATGVACVSRSVIKLYVRLQTDSNDPDTIRQRQRGMAILWQMTISTVASTTATAVTCVSLGAVPGALRNEVVHTVYWLIGVSTIAVLPFVRKTAEIREQHQADQQDQAPQKGKFMRSHTPGSQGSSGHSAKDNEPHSTTSQTAPAPRPSDVAPRPSDVASRPSEPASRPSDAPCTMSNPVEASPCAMISTPTETLAPQVQQQLSLTDRRSSSNGTPLEQLQKREQVEVVVEQTPEETD